MNSIMKRTSVRKFTSDFVEPEKIELLLKAGFAAPSAGNQQPWEFYVVTDTEKLKALSKASIYTESIAAAPVGIVPCFYSDNNFHEEYVYFDMSACCENILIEAVELGLGAVWLGIAPHQDRMDVVTDVLGLPASLKPFAIIPCGYPASIHAKRNRFNDKKIHYVK